MGLRRKYLDDLLFFILIFVLTYVFLRGVEAHADEDHVHTAAHVGTSFMIDTTLYGLNHKVLGMDKETAEVLSGFETFMIGYAYKMNENTNDKDRSRAYRDNLIGIGLAVGVHYVFDF